MKIYHGFLKFCRNEEVFSNVEALCYTLPVVHCGHLDGLTKLAIYSGANPHSKTQLPTRNSPPLPDTLT